jgi:hypothetical protein
MIEITAKDLYEVTISRVSKITVITVTIPTFLHRFATIILTSIYYFVENSKPRDYQLRQPYSDYTIEFQFLFLVDLHTRAFNFLKILSVYSLFRLLF